MIELEQYTQDLAAIRKSILAAGEALHIDHMKEQIDELTEEMNQPEFWNDTARSTSVNQKLGHLKNRLAHYEGLLSSADDIETMMELAREENDEDMVAEAGENLKTLKGTSLGSDGFFPFRDNIDRAAKSGVSYVAEPGGSTRDEDIIQAADDHDMVLVFTHVRLFHH